MNTQPLTQRWEFRAVCPWFSIHCIANSQRHLESLTTMAHENYRAFRSRYDPVTRVSLPMMETQYRIFGPELAGVRWAEKPQSFTLSLSIRALSEQEITARQL